MSDSILGEVLLSARHLVEIATLLFLQSAKREKFYPGRQLIGGGVLTSQFIDRRQVVPKVRLL
jgi:hypothetical protein